MNAHLRSLSVLILGAVALFAESAGALALRTKDVQATDMYLREITLDANVGVTIETFELSPGADTVLHVINQAGGHIASNDDASGLGEASRVTIAPINETRHLLVVVRAYSNSTRGGARITYRYTTGWTGGGEAFPVGGTILNVSATVGLTRFQTAMQAGGTSGTRLLFLSGSVTNVTSTDLRHYGVGAMSVLYTPACSTGCQLVVGSTSSDGLVTLVRDDSWHTDADSDGLSNELEAAIGTSGSFSDTDVDGLPDGNEVYGVESATRPAHLAAWGADPRQRDVFVEADWASGYQLTNAQAQAVVDVFAPEFRIHIDTGRHNFDPATRGSYGAWGGATQTDNRAFCEGWSEEWRRLFHHVLIRPDRTSAGNCSMTDATALAHELGHQLGLGHGGGDEINCKPHHVSEMNYAYQYGRRFSDGKHMGVILNPLSLNETQGLGKSHAETAFLASAPFNYLVSSSGGVDWNRDGVISSGTVQSSLVWNSHFKGCNVGAHAGLMTQASAEHAALVWESSSALSLYYRGPSGLLQRTISASALGTCRTQAPCVQYDPPAGSAARTITSDGGYGRIGADWYSINGVNRTLVAFVGTTAGVARVKYRHRASGGTIWTVGTLPHTGGDPGLGGVSVVKQQYGNADQNHVYVFATKLVGSKWLLRSWRYNTAGTGTWDISDRGELWSTGEAVEAVQAPGVTAGYIKGMSGEQLIAVLQAADDRLHLARYDAASSRWVRLPQDLVPPWNSRAPASIEYVAPAADVTNGRYYLTTVNPFQGDAPTIMQTEGNDLSAAATSRRLRFGEPNKFGGDWTYTHYSTYSLDGPALVYDRRYDTNLRAAFALNAGIRDGAPLMHFFPLADGIFNLQLEDYNEYALMAWLLPSRL